MAVTKKQNGVWFQVFVFGFRLKIKIRMYVYVHLRAYGALHVIVLTI